MSHTPGPWIVDRCDPRFEGESGTMDGRIIEITGPHFRIDGNTGEAVDDHHLIEAAPELLAACEAACEAMGRYNEGTIGHGIAMMCKAAITKAKGFSNDNPK